LGNATLTFSNNISFEKMPQMIDTLNPDKDVTPEEAMVLAGSIYGGCMVNVSLDIYVS
jgi:hypothetical protein